MRAVKVSEETPHFPCSHCGHKHEIESIVIEQQLNCDECGRIFIVPALEKVGEVERHYSYKKHINFEPGLVLTALIYVMMYLHWTLGLAMAAVSSACLIMLIQKKVNQLPLVLQHTAYRLKKFSSDLYLIFFWVILVIAHGVDSGILCHVSIGVTFIYAAISSVAARHFLQKNMNNSEKIPFPHFADFLYPFYHMERINVNLDTTINEEGIGRVRRGKQKSELSGKELKSEVDQRFEEWVDAERNRLAVSTSTRH
jgi:hypothetical protein